MTLTVTQLFEHMTLGDKLELIKLLRDEGLL
jgi:hypothetical protein